jgi:hypothetical protein
MIRNIKNLFFYFLLKLIELYGIFCRFFKSSNFLTRVFRYLKKINDITIYVLEDNKMNVLNNINDVYKYKNNKFYIQINKDNLQKCLVFDNIHILFDIYDRLIPIVQSRQSKFSNYMEVIDKTTNIDIIEIFNQYVDKDNFFFSDITGYLIKPNDLYDFTKNRFVVENGGIEIVQMDLQSKEINFDSPIFEN